MHAALLSELAARFRAVVEEKPLPEGTAELVHALAEEHPHLAGEALEVVADLRSRADGRALALFQQSVRLRLRRGAPASSAVAAAALKAAELARRQKKQAAFLEACGWAVTCEEHSFPPRMAREALAQHHCQRGEFAKALAALGPMTEVAYPFVEFPAGILMGAARRREAAALFEGEPEPFRSGEVLCKVWALHRAGEKKEATRLLAAARKRKGHFYGGAWEAEARALAALVAGRSKKLPRGWHREYGPIADPREHETNLAVFSGVKPLRVTAVATQLHRLAHGQDLGLATLLFKEARQRQTAGEAHERAPHLERLREGIAILDRVNGLEHAGTLPRLRELFWGTTGDEHWAAAQRYLAMSPPADSAAESIASRLALFLAETDWDAALALATAWLRRCLEAGHKAWELAHTVALLHRQRGAHVEEVKSLRQTVELFDPEQHFDEGKQFELKLELAAACRAAGAPDAALEQELDAARAGWAKEWKQGRGAGMKRAIELLTPWLRPGARFTDAPFAVMDEAGKALGWRFLRMQINARPAHGVLLARCRPYAAQTTFSGYAASDVTIESLVTKDTPAIREAFVSTADDVVPLKDHRVYFWWD